MNSNPPPSRVQAPVLGQDPIEATVEDSFFEATITHGPGVSYAWTLTDLRIAYLRPSAHRSDF